MADPIVGLTVFLLGPTPEPQVRESLTIAIFFTDGTSLQQSATISP
jgi:hypothetical protein